MEEFEKHKKDGSINAMWSKMPRVMLAKCAEANALRASFGLGGIYIEEEKFFCASIELVSSIDLVFERI